PLGVCCFMVGGLSFALGLAFLPSLQPLSVPSTTARGNRAATNSVSRRSMRAPPGSPGPLVAEGEAIRVGAEQHPGVEVDAGVDAMHRAVPEGEVDNAAAVGAAEAKPVGVVRPRTVVRRAPARVVEPARPAGAG